MTSILHALHIISTETNPARRYIAKPFTPNGSVKKWGVYDQKAGRYLKEHEIENLTKREIREELSDH